MTQNFKISGDATFFAGEKISILRYSNLLSKTKTTIAQDTIDESGAFAFNLTIDQPEIIILKIEMREITFHAHPGMNLQLKFKPFNNADNQRLPMPFSKQYISIPENIAVDSIYTKIEDDFAAKQLLVSKTNTLKIIYDEFFKESDSTYNNYLQHDTLFKEFYTFFKARSYLRTSASKSYLYNTYLKPSPVNYRSDSYLRFFHLLLGPRVNSVLSKNPTLLKKAKNEFKVYEALVELLVLQDSVFTKETASLALLMYLNGKSAKRFFSTETKAAVISQMANFCTYPDQQTAARDLQKSQLKLLRGSEAPTFELKNEYGKEIKLTSFRSKPVYLGFIHSHSPTCQKDLQIIDRLRKKYRKMTFVIVVVDRDTSSLKPIPTSSGNFHALYLAKDYSILEDYEVTNFPIYYLLDDHGYFLQSTAKKPTDIFETFELMFRKKPRRKSYEIIK